MLIIANNHEHARQLVHDHFSGGDPRWSDWNEASGGSSKSTYAGRWAGENIFGEKADNDTLRYSDDPETADNAISMYLKHRYTDIDRYREQLYADGKQDILFSYNYDHEKDWSAPDEMPLYYAKKLAELLSGEWTSDSAVYDLSTWDTNLSDFRKRVDTDPERQFLVLVDFHF